MKTDVEWADEFYDAAEGHPSDREKRMLKGIQEIKSKAFRAGKLEGFEKSKEICERLAAELHCEDCQECANEIEACFNYLTDKEPEKKGSQNENS